MKENYFEIVMILMLLICEKVSWNDENNHNFHIIQPIRRLRVLKNLFSNCQKTEITFIRPVAQVMTI